MYLYLNLPLLCLLQYKSLVKAQGIYHSYHTYDHYSQSDEKDYSHSTTEPPFEFHDFEAEARNTTELAEKLHSKFLMNTLSYSPNATKKSHYINSLLDVSISR